MSFWKREQPTKEQVVEACNILKNPLDLLSEAGKKLVIENKIGVVNIANRGNDKSKTLIFEECPHHKYPIAGLEIAKSISKEDREKLDNFMQKYGLQKIDDYIREYYSKDEFHKKYFSSGTSYDKGRSIGAMTTITINRVGWYEDKTIVDADIEANMILESSDEEDFNDKKRPSSPLAELVRIVHKKPRLN